jgi:SAM-dependent methyltransferase
MSSHREQNAAVLDQFTLQAGAYARLVGRDVLGRGPGDPVTASGVGADDVVLDVACGAGGMTLDFAEVAKRVTGIDLTPAMLAEARALQARRGVANVEWIEGDALPLPFADAAFTVTVTRASFHHMHDPSLVLAQMARVTAPGGKVVLCDLSPDPDKVAAFDAVEQVRDPSHVHAFPTEDLRALGRDAGLEELHLHAFAAELPLEGVLATSFPGPGALDEVRRRVAADADERIDRLGMKARRGENGLMISYPMTLLVWRKAG